MSYLLKFALSLTAVFAACMGLIRLQPPDDSSLRAFLTPPDGCPAPCFMGIRPGVTTADGALALLRTHEWVASVSYSTAEVIHWTWNGQQPVGVVGDNEEGGFVSLGENNIVVVVVIHTTIPFGDAWLTVDSPPLTTPWLEVKGVRYERETYCAGYPPFYWQTPMVIVIWDADLFGDSGSPERPGCR